MTVLKYKDPADGVWKPLDFPPHTHPATGGARLVGEIIAFAGAIIPAGWLPCVGQVVTAAEHPTLYSVVGTQYGVAGTLPNLAGRTIVGSGGATHPVIGSQFGNHTHGHVGNAMGTHDHTAPASASSDTHHHPVDVASTTTSSAGSHSHSTGLPTANDFVQSGTGGYVSGDSHGHAIGSGGSHSHSVNPQSVNTSNDTHTHTITVNPDPKTAGTPSVQAGDSYQPSTVIRYIIYAGD